MRRCSMAPSGPLCPKLAFPRITRFGIQKKAKPLGHFSRPASSANGLLGGFRPGKCVEVLGSWPVLGPFYPQGERDQRQIARTSRSASSLRGLQFRLFRLKRPAPLVSCSRGFLHGLATFGRDPMKVLASVLDAPKGRQDAAPLARGAFLGPGPAFAGFLS